MHRGLLAILLAGWGCGSASTVAFTLPDLPSGTHSVVLVIQTDTERTIYAYPAGDSAGPPASLEVVNAQEITLVALDETLDDFGFEAGAVTEAPSQSEACGVRNLFAEDRVVYTLDTRVVGAEWMAREEASSELAEVAVQAQCRCVTDFELIRETPIRLFAGDRPAMASDGSIYLTTAESVGAQTWRLDVIRDGEVTPGVIDIGSDFYRLASRGAELWLVSFSGQIARSDGGPLEVVGQFGSQPGERFDDVVVSDLDSDFELFALTQNGKCHHYDGTDSSLVIDPGTTGSGGRQLSRLAWVGPGEVVASIANDGRTFRYREGIGPEVTLTVSGGNGVRTLDVLPGFGPLAGLFSLEVLAFQEGAWTVITELEGPLARLSAVVAFEDGFLAAGEVGGIAHYRPSEPNCRPVPIGVTEIAWMGLHDGLLTVMGRLGSTNPIITTYRPIVGRIGE